MSTIPDPAADQHVEQLLELAAKLAHTARELETTRDSRCVFTHAYSLMTERIAAQLPRFQPADAAWIAGLAVAFAARYYAALAGETDSDAWRAAFAAMRDRRTSVLEDLVFAMSVHILHDLPLALGDVSPRRSPELEHVYDFHAVNDMLKDAVEPIVATTARRYGPYIRWLDRLTYPYDQILTDYGVRMARGLAWYNALRLADPHSADQARAAIEKSPMIIIQDVTDPPIRSLRAPLRIMRWITSFLRRWPKPTSPRGLTLPPQLS